jgi:hypothetical protein
MMTTRPMLRKVDAKNVSFRFSVFGIGFSFGLVSKNPYFFVSISGGFPEENVHSDLFSFYLLYFAYPIVKE